MSTIDRKTLGTGRPLPSFQQWLDAQGYKRRGAGFAHWSNLEALIRTTGKKDLAELSREELAFVRLWQGIGIALVEVCNLESEKRRTPEETLQALPRVLGAMALYTFASVAKEDTPWRRIAGVLVEEFRFGAKFAADHIEAGREIPDGA